MLEARSVTKSYAPVPAVSDVSFTIKPGHVLGYLGPNGSGKSTTVKMLTDLLEPSAGIVLFRGEDIRKDLASYKCHLGYVPGEANLYQYLSGREYLELAGQLRGLEQVWLGEKIDEYLRLLSLHSRGRGGANTGSPGANRHVRAVDRSSRCLPPAKRGGGSRRTDI
jgi:ABC-2 type transport system ATP-binding protein